MADRLMALLHKLKVIGISHGIGCQNYTDWSCYKLKKYNTSDETPTFRIKV